jgi:hypothetical protein
MNTLDSPPVQIICWLFRLDFKVVQRQLSITAKEPVLKAK